MGTLAAPVPDGGLEFESYNEVGRAPRVQEMLPPNPLS